MAITQEVNIEMLEKLPDGSFKKKNPATKASQVKFDDGTTVETHKAEDASIDNVHGLRESAVVLGINSSISTAPSIAIGDNAQATRWSVSIGNGAQTMGARSIAIGGNAKQTSTVIGGVVIGEGASISGSGSAIGYQSTAGVQGTAIGSGATAANTGVALGRNSVSENPNEGVLGRTTYTNEWLVPGSFTVSGAKNFEIPHPKPEKKATHRIRHGAVESPTAGDTLYRFKVQSTKENDLQYIDLPDYFIYLNKDVQIFVTGQGHFGNGYGELNEETEQLEISCQSEGEYNVLVIGTRNDDHQSVWDWDIKGVEREIGESWTGETYAFSVEEIIEVEEIKEEVA